MRPGEDRDLLYRGSQPELLAGVCEAVHGARARPNVIVITWGQPEELWPRKPATRLDAVLQDAVRLGITVLASAGIISPPIGCQRAGKAHVDYPASSPYVLGWVARNITLDAGRTKIVNEVVWNERADAVPAEVSANSTFVPAFQSGVQLPNSLQRRQAATAACLTWPLPPTDAMATVSSSARPKPLPAERAPWPRFGPLSLRLLNEQRGTALGFINEQIYQ